MEFLKKAVKSKTVWSGVLKIVAGIGMLCTGEQTAQQIIVEIIPIVWGLADILIRIYTDRPLSAK